MTTSFNSVEVLYALGRWLVEQRRDDDAADPFRAIALAAPTDERGWLGLGLVHERRGDATAAMLAYETGASAARSARCHVARARLLAAMDLPDAAELAMQEAERLADEAPDDDALAAILGAERAGAAS